MKASWSCIGHYRILLTLAALFTSLQGQHLAPLDPPVTVNVATDFSASDGAYYIAYARGYFEELGLQIKFIQFPSSTEMLPMLAIDQIQVAGGITSTSFFNAIDRGVGIRFLAEHTDLKDVTLWKKVSVPGLNPNGYFFKESLSHQLEWYKQKGYYKGSLSVEKVTDYGPVDFALRHLGRYDNYPLEFE